MLLLWSPTRLHAPFHPHIYCLREAVTGLYHTWYKRGLEAYISFYSKPLHLWWPVFMPYGINRNEWVKLKTPVWHFKVCKGYTWCLTLSVLILEYSRRTRSVPWLLMAWMLSSPGPHWLCRINRSLSSIRMDFKGMHSLNSLATGRFQFNFT